MKIGFQNVSAPVAIGLTGVGLAALAMTFFPQGPRFTLNSQPDHSPASPAEVSAKLMSLPASHRQCMVQSIEGTNGALSRWQLASQADTCNKRVGGAELHQQQIEAAKATLSCR
jgi:hypothetical protein